MTKSEGSQKPKLEVQRQMIERKRDQFREMGFDSELEIATLKVQKPLGPEEEREKAKALTDLRSKADNCYRSAKELGEMLASLPEPKKQDSSAEKTKK